MTEVSGREPTILSQPDYQSEAELLAAARNGSSPAFATLVERYWTAIHIYLLRLSGEAELAADLTQETFFKAYQAITRLPPHNELNFRAWLYKIATNLALSDRRSKKDKSWLSLDKVEQTNPLIDYQTNVVDVSLNSENSRQVVAAMKQLPKEQVSVLLLRFYQEMSYDEMSAVLGIKPDAVRARVHRARLAFARVFSQFEKDYSL